MNEEIILNYLISNAVVFAVLKLTYKENEAKDTTPFCWYGICATTYIAAMLASNKALQWVNYPTQVGLSSYLLQPLFGFEN